MKASQRIGRKDSIQAACRRMRRLEAFQYLAAQNYKLFSKTLNQILKNLKRIEVNVLSWGYSIEPLSGRSGRTVSLKWEEQTRHKVHFLPFALG